MTALSGGLRREAAYTYLTAMRDEVGVAYGSWLSIQDARRQLRSVASTEDAEDGVARLEEVEAQDQLTAALQSLLTAQARLSLFLYPQGTSSARARTRAKELLRLLNIDGPHLISAREPRNTWMHLDESIDRYIWEHSPDGVVLSHYGDVRAAEASGDARRVVRLIDPMANVILLFGKSFDIEALFNVVKDVGRRVEQAIETLEASA